MNFLAKVITDEDGQLMIKIPKDLIDELKLERNSFLSIEASEPKEHIIELKPEVIKELKHMKETFPFYKNMEINEILKDMMLKYNKAEQHPKKEIKIVEKGTL